MRDVLKLTAATAVLLLAAGAAAAQVLVPGKPSRGPATLEPSARFAPNRGFYYPYPSYSYPAGGYYGYNAYSPFYGPGYGGDVVNINVNPAPAAPAAPAQPDPAGPRVVASGVGVAEVHLTLPTSGEVWLNGEKQKGIGDGFTLSSPQLGPGESFAFRVRAEWTADGGRVGAEQTLSVKAGDRQKLPMLTGDPVRQ